MTDNSRKVFEYLKKVNEAGEKVTAAEVAEAVGVSIPAVTGSFNGLVKKELGFREEDKVEVDGKEKDVKYLILNKAAFSYDPDAK